MGFVRAKSKEEARRKIDFSLNFYELPEEDGETVMELDTEGTEYEDIDGISIYLTELKELPRGTQFFELIRNNTEE
jgi:hypothetical protein